MKKIILLGSFLFLCGMTQAQEQHQWPAAYSNITGHVVGEHVTPVDGVPNFDPTVPIARSSSSVLFERPDQEDLLFDNGSVFNIESPLLSVLQGSLGMTTYGANASASDYAMADDFTLDSDSDISTMEFYTYQTSAGSPPTIYGIFVQVYDNDPSAGGVVVWGDMTTDRYLDSEMTGGNRVLEGNEGNTDRKIEKVVAETSGLSLEAGTYWVEVSFMGMESSGPWAPPISILGEPTTGDGLQRVPAGWQAWVDSGSGTAQGLPFQVYGTETLGVNDHSQIGLSFYPNPMSEVLNITANAKIENVRVFNMLGQQVANVPGLKNGQLDVSSFASGTYLVEVKFEGGSVQTFKVLK